MDRIDAMKVFVTALDEGSLVGAARKLGRSPAAVSRAIAFLENHVGAPLLHRTTRTIRISEAGERYAAACRRALVDLEEADMIVADEKSAPRGVLSITAPVASGEMILRPIIDAFMDAVPTVSVRLYLFDRPVNLIDEGHDVALRFAHLQDSTLTAVKVGEIRRLLVAAPAYLDAHPPINDVADLTRHKTIAMSHFGIDSWSFPPAPGAMVPRTVALQPRLVVNTVHTAVASAVEGRGITRLSSHHVAAELKTGALRRLLEADEPPPMPVNLITPHGRLAIPKVRAFVDFASPRLRTWLDQLDA
jgi:DNA-binding transcriptional LysR family regulator